MARKHGTRCFGNYPQEVFCEQMLVSLPLQPVATVYIDTEGAAHGNADCIGVVGKVIARDEYTGYVPTLIAMPHFRLGVPGLRL